MRIFRVLIIDDVGFDQLRIRWENDEGDPANFLARDELKPAYPRMNDLFVHTCPLQKHYHLLHAYVARDVFFDQDSPHVLAITADTPKWSPEFLSELDVLVLDLGFEDRHSPSDWSLPAGLSKNQEERIRDNLHGVGFYLNERLKPSGKIHGCQCVVILSKFDGHTSTAEVQELIDPLCHDGSEPFTVKFSPGKNPDDDDDERTGFAAAAGLIKSLAHDFFSGYTQLDHRGAIEFAASHDEPVLIVGETGTGKEYVARAIHRRWVQEQERRGNKHVNGTLVTVNCAALVKELARTELFGSVYGSYTGSQGHQIGLILEACGFKRPPFGKPTVDFEVALRKASRGLLPEKGDDLKITIPRDPSEIPGDPSEKEKPVEKVPLGTLFLDELADLPIEVQTYLLRYLESFEVLALDGPRPVENARVRLIAATSDPRVAAFVGETVFAPRSKAELERPLRDDFLFRLKGQIIRTQRISSSSARAAVQHAVKHSDPRWSQGAIDHLADGIGKLAGAIEKAVATGVDTGVRFGHRREIERIVRLASAYVREAHRRGLRTVGAEITEEVIDRVWKPSTVSSSRLHPSDGGDDFTDRPATVEALRARIEEICKAGSFPLKEKWSKDDFLGHVKAHFLRPDPTGVKLLELFRMFTGKRNPHAQVLRDTFGYTGDNLDNTVGTWFDPKRTTKGSGAPGAKVTPSGQT